MANLGDSIFRGGSFRQVGQGQSMSPADLPKYTSVSYSSWRRGMTMEMSPENTPADAGRDVMDLMIDRDDSLIRPPGIVQAEDVSPRSLRWLFQQAALDYATELVAIDAPYLGYKSSGNFTFANAGINNPGVHGWNAVNILGILLFSDGSASTYSRIPGAAVVTDLSGDIIALTFANAFARTFAGAYTDPIEGFQGLGIRWNGTSGDVDDWAGAGSGEELLISNSLEADKIVALRPIGFDALGILCRNSLWIGYPTGQADRPADFRIRTIGIGCVSEPTATISPAGVSFLSDEGVYNYNQNDLTCISEAINSELLPINYTQLDRYKMIYNPVRELLMLQTPTGTWVYEFPQKGIHDGRWTRRSYSYDNLVIFTDQSGNLYWDTIQGTWDSQVLTWDELVISQEDSPPVLYAADGSILGMEDSSGEQYLGVDMTPRWETMQSSKDVITEQITTMGFEIEYLSSADSVIKLETPDENGDFTNSVNQALVSTVGRRRRALIWSTSTGMGAKLRYSIVSGRPKIFSIRQILMDSGPVIGSAA